MSMAINYAEEIRRVLSQADIAVQSIDERTFPGERWLIAYVPADKLLLAQSLVGEVEQHLSALSHDDEHPEAYPKLRLKKYSPTAAR